MINLPKASPDKLYYTVLLFSAVFITIVVVNNLFTGKIAEAKGFLLGSIGSLLYMRMQAIYAGNFAKSTAKARFKRNLANGRIIIIVAILYVAIKRTDVLDTLSVIWGLFSVHLISLIIIAYQLFSNSEENKK